MAIAKVMLGGEIDVASGGELDSAKESILGKLSEGSKPKGRFIDRRLYGSGVAPATGLFVIELYPIGPATGRIWNLTQIVTLQDDHTAVNGVSVSWYLGDSSNVSLGQCIKPAMSVPADFEFSKDVIWHDKNEQLFGVVYGAAAGTQFVLTARERDFEQCDVIEQMI